MDLSTLPTTAQPAAPGSPGTWVAISALLVVGVAALKLVSGDALTVSSLYLVPVVIAAWNAGRGPSIAVAGLAGFLYQIEHALGDDRPMSTVSLNALLILAGCGAAIALVTRYRSALEERTAATGLLEGALANVRTVRGTWTMCRACKSVRGAGGEWEPVEDFVTHHSLAGFVLSRCPSCKHASSPPSSG